MAGVYKVFFDWGAAECAFILSVSEDSVIKREVLLLRKPFTYGAWSSKEPQGSASTVGPWTRGVSTFYLGDTHLQRPCKITFTDDRYIEFTGLMKFPYTGSRVEFMGERAETSSNGYVWNSGMGSSGILTGKITLRGRKQTT